MSKRWKGSSTRNLCGAPTNAADGPQREQAERARINDADWESVLEALPAKRGSARAATVQILLDAHPKEMTQQMKLNLGGILDMSLSDLPPEKQVSTLEWDWDLIKSPRLLPTLQTLAKKQMKDPGNNGSTSYTTRELKSIALERWYELDPDSARQDAIRQIGSAHPSMTAESLYFLGDQSLPQFENMWAHALMTTTDYQMETVFASLLAHFGTGGYCSCPAESRSAGWCWACAPQGAALGYLAKLIQRPLGH